MTTVNRATWAWPVDVADFAREQGIDQYLEPLRAAAHQVFPMLKELRVFLRRDPENADDRYLVWELELPRIDVATHRELSRSWGDQLYRIVPAPKAPLICGLIVPEKE